MHDALTGATTQDGTDIPLMKGKLARATWPFKGHGELSDADTKQNSSMLSRTRTIKKATPTAVVLPLPRGFQPPRPAPACHRASQLSRARPGPGGGTSGLCVHRARARKAASKWKAGGLGGVSDRASRLSVALCMRSNAAPMHHVAATAADRESPSRETFVQAGSHSSIGSPTGSAA